MVHYYWDMWAKCSGMLVPLTDLVEECGKAKVTKKNETKKKPCRWDQIHQQAFANIKAAIAKEVVLAYPDFLKASGYTDAPATQLGAMITQDNMSDILQQETI